MLLIVLESNTSERLLFPETLPKNDSILLPSTLGLARCWWAMDGRDPRRWMTTRRLSWSLPAWPFLWLSLAHKPVCVWLQEHTHWALPSERLPGDSSQVLYTPYLHALSVSLMVSSHWTGGLGCCRVSENSIIVLRQKVININVLLCLSNIWYFRHEVEDVRKWTPYCNVISTIS